MAANFNAARINTTTSSATNNNSNNNNNNNNNNNKDSSPSIHMDRNNNNGNTNTIPSPTLSLGTTSPAIQPIHSLDVVELPSTSVPPTTPTNIIQSYNYGFAPELSDFILYVPYYGKFKEQSDIIPSKLATTTSSSSITTSTSPTVTTNSITPTTTSTTTSPSPSPSPSPPALTAISPPNCQEPSYPLVRSTTSDSSFSTCSSGNPPYIAHHIHKQVLASSCQFFTTLFIHDTQAHNMILPNMSPHANHLHIQLFLQLVYQQPATQIVPQPNQQNSPPSLSRRHSSHIHIKDETNLKRMQQEMTDAKALAFLSHYFHNDSIAAAAETRLLGCLPSLEYTIYSNDVATSLHLLIFAQSYHMSRLMDECIARLVHDNSLHYIVAPSNDDKLNIFSAAYKYKDKKGTLPSLEHLNHQVLLKLLAATTRARMREKR